MKEVSAGGIVFRHLGQQLQIQLIQDRYGKITLPKGKMEAGETVEQTALREIMEETGIEGRIVEPLELVTYKYSMSGVGAIHKEVHYFLVEATGGKLAAQIEEIRGVEWLTPDDAWKQQSHNGYGNNDSVVRKALNILGVKVE